MPDIIIVNATTETKPIHRAINSSLFTEMPMPPTGGGGEA